MKRQRLASILSIVILACTASCGGGDVRLSEEVRAGRVAVVFTKTGRAQAAGFAPAGSVQLYGSLRNTGGSALVLSRIIQKQTLSGGVTTELYPHNEVLKTIEAGATYDFEVPAVCEGNRISKLTLLVTFKDADAATFGPLSIAGCGEGR